MDNMVRVFIGFDKKEEIAFHVLSRSIIKHASKPVAIIPVALDHLNGVFTRPYDQLQSTEFAFSRFLVPWMCNYQGWAVFMDCDMLVASDIYKLWQQRDPQYALQVVKHDYTPRDQVKFLNNAQSVYKKKNWSSFMLMNCEQCKTLTPEYVGTATGLELHQFKWLDNDQQIGDLSISWNYLVGEYSQDIDVDNYHYTRGGPWFDNWRDGEHAQIWRDELREMLSVDNKIVKI